MIEFEGVVTFIRDGGKFMLPIAAVAIFSLVVVSERLLLLIYLSAVQHNLLRSLKSNDKDGLVKAFEHNKTNHSMLFSIINPAIALYKSGRGRDAFEYQLSEGLMKYNRRVFKRTAVIAILANIATLLGLLGTIMGLIDSFAVVANADPAAKGALLSASVSVAMNTTAFGLMVAIPLLLLHTYITGKATDIYDNAEIFICSITNQLFNRNPRRMDEES